MNATSSLQTSLKKEKILVPIFNIIDTAVCVTDENGIFEDVNKHFCKILGYTKKEIVGQHFSMALPAESVLIINNIKQHPLQKHQLSLAVNIKMQHKNGTLILKSFKSVPLKHTDGKKYMVSSITDSNQNNITEAHAQQSENNNSAVTSSLTAFFVTDQHGNILEANEAAANMFGYKLSAFMKLNKRSIINVNDPDYLVLLKTKKKKGKVKGHITGIRKNKKHFPCQFSSITYQGLNGHLQTNTIVIDVSERKNFEEKIKQSQENLNAVFENIEEGIILIGADFNIKIFNKNARLYSFLTADLQVGANIFNYIEEPRKEYFTQIIHRAFQGEIVHYERHAINKSTELPIWLSFSINPVNDGEKINAVCIIGRNITAQKAKDKLIDQTQNLLNRAENIANIGSAEIDFESSKRIWSDGFYKIVGLPPGSNIPSGDGILDILHPDERDAYKNWLQNGLANKIEEQQIETRIITAAGIERNIMAYGSTTYNNFGKPNKLIGVIQDITDRKRMESDLKISHDIYQSLFYQNLTAVFSLDLDGNFTSVNKILSIKSGCSEEQLLQLNYVDFLPESEIAATKIHFENTKRGENQEYELKINTATGEQLTTFMVSLPIIINDKVTGVFCMATDITQEINAKMEFEKTLADRQRILDYSLDVICEMDEDGNFIQVSKACEEMWGYKVNELIGTPYINLVVEDDKDISLKTWAMLESGGYVTSNFENRYYKKNGEIINLIWSLRWEEKDRTMYCIAKDASEIKAQEQALKLSEQWYRYLFNNSPLPLYIFTFSTQYIVEVNNAALKKYGYAREEFLWLTMQDLSSSEDLATFEKMLLNENSFTNFNNYVCKHVKRNGEIIYMNITGNIIDYKGTKCVLIFSDDVTEKIRAEYQKEAERTEKEALINNTIDQIWSINADFTLIAGNTSFIEIVKLHTGKTFIRGDYLLSEEYFTEELINSWKKLYSESMAGKSILKEMVITDLSTNELQWNEVSFNPIYNMGSINGVACYSRNITKNKLQNIELINSNKKLENAQQMAKLGYWEFNIETKQSFWSNEIYNIFGLTKTTSFVPIEQIFNIVHQDDRKDLEEAISLTLNEQQPLNFEHRIVLKDGTVKMVLHKGTLKYNEDAKPITLEGTVQDITQQKIAEQAIKESELKYRKIFDSNPLPNWIYDLQTLKILEVNNAASEHYGYSASEFLGMNIDNLFVENHIVASTKMNNEISKPGIINFGQWNHIKKNGEIINVDINGHAINYNDRNAVMIVSNDITEIIQSQLALIKSNERFEYATRATFDAIWDHNLINNTMFWGEGFNTLFGYNIKQDEAPVNFRQKFTHPDDIQSVNNSLKEVINNPLQTYWKSEYRFRKMDGTYATVNDSALVVKDKYGKPYRIIGAMQDVTERIKNVIELKQLNTRLNKRAAELALSNKELEQFAYIASHDLQEPLRMVSRFLGQLQKKYDSQLDETGKLYIRFAVDGAVRMKRIILDLLEYSRVGTQPYQYENIDTQNLITEVVSIYSNIINEKKIIITYENLPFIYAVKTSVHQLFQNLISNAIKYQHPDIIPKIKISCVEQKDFWQFSVADNGIGINMEYFNKIFVLFQRLHNKDEYSGTGIGLAICKKIIDNYNGKLWVTSEPGKGSTFYFTIPKQAITE